jgi:hypothetical protein
MENGGHHNHVLVYMKIQKQLDIQKYSTHDNHLQRHVPKRNDSNMLYNEVLIGELDPNMPATTVKT